jgi:regulatory protein
VRRRSPQARAASAAPQGHPRTAGLVLLGRRDYTTRELTEKLQRKGYDAAEVDAAIRSLAGDGLLDDRRVAAAYVRTASRIKGRGRLRIARELEARGIARGLAEEVLARLPADVESEAIQKILSRKRWPERPSIADRRRMFQHLLRRGFPADVIAKALRGA